jgi:hypothetical protein
VGGIGVYSRTRCTATGSAVDGRVICAEGDTIDVAAKLAGLRAASGVFSSRPCAARLQAIGDGYGVVLVDDDEAVGVDDLLFGAVHLG